MKVYKIVLTGGPGGGKTTILNNIKDRLQTMGYTVFVVPETARIFMDNGIKSKKDYEYTLKFQDAILKEQSLREKITEQFAEMEKETNDVVILYDRAILDNRAYLEKQTDFNKLMQKNSLTELNTVDKYDLVLNLVSLAAVNKSAYVNDPIRTESPAEAEIRDTKTSNAWLLHRNMKMILPTKEIEEKEEIVMEHIMNLLEGKQISNSTIYPLAHNLANNLSKDFDENNSKTVGIVSFYLKMPNTDKTYKLSHREYKDQQSFILETYNETDGNIVNYESQILTNYEFDALLKKHPYSKYDHNLETKYIKNFKLHTLRLLNAQYFLEIESNTKINGNKTKNFVKK